MKPIMIFGLFIMALIFAQFAHAQTVDEVVDKYIAAKGGKEKLASLKTVRMEGSLSVQGTDVVLTITTKHLVGMRVDISVMGTENYQIITPAKGTTFMPVQGMTEPKDIPEKQLKASQPQLDLTGSLVDYKVKGTTVELLGNEKVDGDECYKLKLTYKSGTSATYFISTKTAFLIKTVGKTTVNGEEMEVSNTYSNYKQNADGYWFPYTSTSMQGTTDFSKIETNVAVDESIFK